MKGKLNWIEIWMYLWTSNKLDHISCLQFMILKGYENGTFIVYYYNDDQDLGTFDSSEEARLWISEDEFVFVERKYINT